MSNQHYVHRYNPENYEFLLEYPDDFPGKYNRWTQTKDPLDDPEENVGGSSVQKAQGYTKVKLSWESKFGGLMLSISPNTLLDGQTGDSNYRYAIGQFVDKWNHTLAGPITEQVENVMSVLLDKNFITIMQVNNK